LLKKLRKRLLETESTDEVEELKKQMHVAEVDLNYTQYCPLSEVYVGLYPKETPPGEGREGPKPPIWAEVQKCMEDGTLNKLRNRTAAPRTNAPRPIQQKPAKEKAQTQAPAVDTTGLNRRERRRLLGVQEKGHGKRSLAFEKSKSTRSQEGKKNDIAADVEAGASDSDGGFFEE
jgi:hypothetical protein